MHADDAINYGGIGTVIGHEITHSFDDQGSKFDGTGNRKTWWTKQDRVRFEKKAKVLVKEFNGYSVVDGLKVNGKLTLGENIADLGGASIAFDAYKLRLAKTGRKDVGGFTPEQRFSSASRSSSAKTAAPKRRKPKCSPTRTRPVNSASTVRHRTCRSSTPPSASRKVISFTASHRTALKSGRLRIWKLLDHA